MEDMGFFHKGIYVKRFLSHSASDLAKSRAINSAYIVDLAIQVCLDDFQPSRVKINRFMNLVSSKSKIQLVSKYPPSKFGYPP